MLFSLSTSVFADQIEDYEGGGGNIEDGYVSVFSGKRVGGGTWDYGKKPTGIFKKTKRVWSNYWHPKETHGSSAQLGAKTPNRSCVKKDLESKASQSSSNTSLTAYAYWNKSCSTK